MQLGQFGRIHRHNLYAGQLGHPVDPGLVLLAVDHVELARLEREVAARIRGNIAIRDVVDQWRATEILLVGYQLDELLRLVFREHERPGADGFLREILAHLLRGLLADHVAAIDIGDVA